MKVYEPPSEVIVLDAVEVPVNDKEYPGVPPLTVMVISPSLSPWQSNKVVWSIIYVISCGSSIVTSITWSASQSFWSVTTTVYVPAYKAFHSKTLAETSTGLPIDSDSESVAVNI